MLMLPVPVTMETDAWLLVILRSPVTSVPMRFPWTTVPVAMSKTMWSPPFKPEMRLRSAGAVPPMRAF